MRARGVVLALWGRQAQLEDACAEAIWTGNGGIVVAQNLASEAEIDSAMAQAKASRRAHPETGGKCLLGRL